MKHVILVDKPKGMTSRKCVNKVKEILGAKKAGHSGTLDTGVTGVLLVALDEAVKAMPVLMGLDKEYVGRMVLHADVEQDKIREVAKSFVGKVKQLPPIKSAVSRKEREKEIYSLDMKSRGREINFRIRCEAGFYVRKFCHDFGQTLGCGAHMVELRRIQVGPFSQCVKLENLGEKNKIRLEEVLYRVSLKKIIVKEEFLNNVRNGIIKKEFIEESDKLEEGYVGIFDNKENIIALGLYNGGRVKPDRIFL